MTLQSYQVQPPPISYHVHFSLTTMNACNKANKEAMACFSDVSFSRFYRKIRHSELSSQFEIITLFQVYILQKKNKIALKKSALYLKYESIYYISNNLEIISLRTHQPIHFNLNQNHNTCCTNTQNHFNIHLQLQSG